MSKNNSHWFIVGHGAIGLLWAHSLCTASPVNLILRNQPIRSSLLEQTKTDYTYIDIAQQAHVITLNTTCLTQLANSQVDNKALINQLLIPVKAYDVVPALKQLQPFLSDTCTIILCHNGMGTIEQVQTLLTPQQSLYIATTTHGAYKTKKQTVKHTGLGETKIGLIQGSHSLATTTNLLTPISWQQNISQTLWHKLAINCVINPLTAINNCKNGDLAQPQYRQVITQICEEFSQVANLALTNQTPAKATNTTNTTKAKAKAKAKADNQNHPFDSQQLLTQCLKVIKATANNYSSMHQDIKHHRTSEIDYITGFIINTASALNLSVPTHQLIYRQFSDIASTHQQD